MKTRASPETELFDAPAELPVIPYRRLEVKTDDGVTLAVQSVGRGKPVLVANGIGVRQPGLDFIVDHLRRRHRVICWDYRGVGDSRLPRWPMEVGMARHAEDALAVIDALRLRRVAVLGWSMGVTVGIELIRRAPERVAALVALFGVEGQQFRAAFPRPFSDLVHLLVLGACRVSTPAQLLLRLGSAVPPLAWTICSGIRFCGTRANRAVFQEHVRSTTGAEKRAYFATMRALMYHDASDVLPQIRCPVLAVAGDRDWVTPREAIAKTVRRIPGAKLVVLPGTSHFGVIEHGPSLWRHVDDVLAVARWGRAG